ncbi:hypothetical protein D3C86_473270 [compost metagenome]
MKQRRRAISLIGVFPLALSLMLGACAPPPQSPAVQDQKSGNESPATTPVPSQLLGKAFLDEPIAGATLKVVGVSGQVIHEAANATDANGYFSIPFSDAWPRDFRVEISGGTRGGNASPLVLKADVRSFSPLVDRVYLNAATTLVAAKLDMTPSASLAETQLAVASYLKLPESVSLGVDLDNPQLNAFHHGKFMTQAESEGGFTVMIMTMAWDMAGGTTTPHDFTNPMLQAGGEIAKTIAIELGKGALGKIGGSAMGWALNSIFGSGGGSDRTDEVLNELAAQRAMLYRLDNKIVELQSSVNAIKASIAALEVSMNKQFGLAAYNTKVDALLTSIGTIDGLFDSYADEIRRLDGSAAGKARVEALANDIRSRVPSALTTIHLAMLGTGGGDGAIAQWHRLVGHRNRDGENGGNRYPYLVNGAFVDQLNEQLDYFEGVQLRGIMLLVEARNFRGDGIGAQGDYDRYMANLNAQKQAIYSTRLTSGDVLISPYSGVMWDKSPLPNGATITFSIEKGSLPVLITQKLAAHTTAGFQDWRLPTDLELYYLGAPKGRYSDFRMIPSLQAAGFTMSKAISENINVFVSQTKYENLYVGLYPLQGGLVEFIHNPTPRGAVLPARTFKKDTLATF